MGTGVKAGGNVWRALRPIRDAHPTWAHLGGVPATEADLMLHLSMDGPEAGGDDNLAHTADHSALVFATVDALRNRQEAAGRQEAAEQEAAEGKASAAPAGMPCLKVADPSAPLTPLPSPTKASAAMDGGIE